MINLTVILSLISMLLFACVGAYVFCLALGWLVGSIAFISIVSFGCILGSIL